MTFLGLSSLAADAGERPIPNLSGLPWASGASATFGDKDARAFEAWRGNRPLDVRTVFLGLQSWTHQRTSARVLRQAIDQGPGRVVVAIGMVPQSHGGQLEQCAAGQFDAEIRTLTAVLLANGAKTEAQRGRPLLIRLGWEANLVNGIYPWRATGDGTSWRQCFQRWVDILDPPADHDRNWRTPKQRTQRFLILWNMANRGTIDYPIENLWPGDAYVDIVGSQFYDRCPPLPVGNEAEWDRRLNFRTVHDNPGGPQAWLDYAKAKGKPYAMPEWGVGGPVDICPKPGVDNPYFMRKMYEFFWRNAEHIAFEAYFNGHGHGDDSKGSHMLLASGLPSALVHLEALLGAGERYNPLSAAAYRSLWGEAVEPLPPELPTTPPPASDTLYWLRYVASHPDLIAALGADPMRAQTHWRLLGRPQGRAILFDPVAYLDLNPSLKGQFRNDWTAATRHYIETGAAQGLSWRSS